MIDGDGAELREEPGMGTDDLGEAESEADSLIIRIEDFPATVEGEQAYFKALAKCARNEGKRWSAAHSRGARGALSGHWATAPYVLDEVRDILRLHGLPDTFGLDVAASPGSAVAPAYFGPFNFDAQRRNALVQESWEPPIGTASWLNPPYSEIKAFAERCAKYKGKAPLLFLSFARTDTAWFHDNIVKHATATWLRKGRIKFIDPLTGKVAQVAPAPSLLAMFGDVDLGAEGVRSCGKWQAVKFVGAMETSASVKA